MNRILTVCLVVFSFLGLRQMASGQKILHISRLVVVEEFVSVTSASSRQANEVMTKLLNNPVYREKLFSVRYHMNTPYAGDPFYAASQADVEQRMAYYGITNDPLPAIRINGRYDTVQSTNDTSMRAAINAQLNITSSSPATVEVSQQREGNTMTVTVTVMADDDGEGMSGVKLRAAAVEGYVNDPSIKDKGLVDYNGETEFHDVMRRLIAGPNGEDVTLAMGETKTFTMTYTLDPAWQYEQMYVVAWLQDDSDRTILQSGHSKSIASGVDDVPATTGFSLAPITPNPATGSAIIGYSLGAPAEVTIEVRDLTGALVASIDRGRTEAGTWQHRLDVSRLPVGVYACLLRAGTYHETKMMTVMR